MDEDEARSLFTAAFRSRHNAAGLRDDAAIVPGGGRIVVTTDAFRDGTHFPPGTRPEDAAYLATAGSLSDIAAMGARPIGVLVALGLPPSATEKTVTRLADGVASCLREHGGGELLGGDTKPAPALELVTTALGRLPRRGGLLRDAARPGDVVCVTGPLGGAGAALAMVEAGTLAVARAAPLLRPTPRLRTGAALVRARVGAGLDLSDGLAAGARLLSEASEVRIDLAAQQVPLHALAAKAGHEAGLRLALEAGGDYELLVAVAPQVLPRATKAARRSGSDLHVVGRVSAGAGAHLMRPDGSARPLRGGYVHQMGAPRGRRRR